MRKFLSLILCCILIIPYFVFSSNADSSSLNILPYLNGSQSVSFDYATTFHYVFNFSESMTFKYIDFLLEATSTPNIFTSSSGSDLSVDLIGSNLYRIHGLCPVTNVTSFTLVVSNSPANSSYNLVKANIMYTDNTFNDVEIDYKFTDDYRNLSGSVSTYPLSFDTTYVSSASVNTFYLLNCEFDWEKYDRVLISFYNATNLIDFNAHVDDINVVTEWQVTGQHYGYALLDFSELQSGKYSNICYFNFSGQDTFYSDSIYPMFRILSVTGFVDLVEDSFWPAWMKRIIDKFDQLIDSLTGTQQDLDNSNSFNESVSDQATELEDMTSIMISVDQPDIADVNLNLNGVVDSNSVVLATTGFKTILQNEIILKVLLIAFTFALVGFILYGKKG